MRVEVLETRVERSLNKQTLKIENKFKEQKTVDKRIKKLMLNKIVLLN